MIYIKRILEKFSKIKKYITISYCGISDMFVESNSEYDIDFMENIKKEYNFLYEYIL